VTRRRLTQPVERRRVSGLASLRREAIEEEGDEQRERLVLRQRQRRGRRGAALGPGAAERVEEPQGEHLLLHAVLENLEVRRGEVAHHSPALVADDEIDGDAGRGDADDR